MEACWGLGVAVTRKLAEHLISCWPRLLRLQLLMVTMGETMLSSCGSQRMMSDLGRCMPMCRCQSNGNRNRRHKGTWRMFRCMPMGVWRSCKWVGWRILAVFQWGIWSL